MTSIINGSSPTVTFSDGTTQATAGLPLTGGTVTGNVTTSGLTIGTTPIGAGNATRFKNRIINGDMRIDQRNAGASVTPSANPQYLVDRFASENSQTGKFAYQQNAGSVTPPIGFTNYLGATSQSAYSISSSDYFLLQQKIEGFNVADLGWGTANAKTITLSFWVRSSLTGTFGGNLQNNANNRFYPYSYTILSANTWEQKIITITGDTTGTWETTTSTGILIRWSLGTGSTYLGTSGSWGSSTYLGVTGQTNIVSTNGATFYITGVQLEVGSSATGFEYVDYGTQLVMCQRYYELKDWQGNAFRFATVYTNGANAQGYQEFVVTKRTAPSISWSANGGGRYISPAGVNTGLTFTSSVISIYGASYATTATFNASTGWVDTLGNMQISAEL